MKNEITFARQSRTAPRECFGGGGCPTDRHPSDWNWTDTALVIAIAVAVVCIGLGVTAWADVPFGEVR